MIAEETSVLLNDPVKFVNELNKKSVEAMTLIFQRFYSKLCVISTKIVDDQQAAEDIVQQIFTNLLETKSKIKSVSSLEVFLFTVTKQSSLKYLRDKKIREKNHTALGYHQDPAENDFFNSTVLRDITMMKVSEIISKMNGTDLAIMTMSLQGLATTDIAKELDMTPNHVRVAKHRCLKFIRKELAHNEFMIFIILCGSTFSDLGIGHHLN